MVLFHPTPLSLFEKATPGRTTADANKTTIALSRFIPCLVFFLWRQSCLGSGVAPSPLDPGDWLDLKERDLRTVSPAVAQLFLQTVPHQDCLAQGSESERHRSLGVRLAMELCFPGAA